MYPAKRFRIHIPPVLLPALVLVLLLSSHTASSALTGAQITIEPSDQYQTITGWEATAQAGQTECAGFPLYRDEVFRRAANELGINRLRQEVKSGVENQRDWWTDYRSGDIDYTSYRNFRYNPVNDNNDPFSINWDGFQFSELDHNLESVVLPMKEQLELRGERLFLNVNFVGFINQEIASKQNAHSDPQEYAEFVLAVHIHMKEKYGLVPDAWEVILEPDNVQGWDGTAIGNAIAASAQRLSENGFETRFIAPSTTSMENASQYFDQMIQIPGVLDYLLELSYHRYSDVSMENLQSIATRASEHGIDASMLEHIGSGHNDLHQDLDIGGVSAWQQYTLAYCAEEDDGSEYYIIDNHNPENPVVRLSERARYLSQYFHYIRPGAVRIKASSNQRQFKPLAFIHPDGELVVVVNAETAGELHLGGLPAGNYLAHFTTSDANQVESTVMQQGAEYVTSIPAEGVITIHQVSQPPPDKTEAALSLSAGETNQPDLAESSQPINNLPVPSPTLPMSIAEVQPDSPGLTTAQKFSIAGIGFLIAALLLGAVILRRTRL